MPLAAPFDNHRFTERVQRIRQTPLSAITVAVAAVAVATLVRFAIAGYAIEGIPFITYYPAIILAALLGGFWPGVFATIASAVLAWLLFMRPELGLSLTSAEIVSLLLFISISFVNVVLVALLNAAIDRVMTQEQNVRVLLESAPNGIVVVDDMGQIRTVNASTEKLFGYNRSELIGRSVEILVPPPLAIAHKAEREAFQKRPESRLMGIGRDLSGRRKDGSEFPVEIGLNPVIRSGSRAVLATVIDISERKRAQDRQQFLISELQHRSRNLFAVIQSIAARSFDRASTPAEGIKVFSGRLQALARAHELLADAAWEGAPLTDLLKKELEGFIENIDVNGCDIIINTAAAQQFALIIHELATNAAKYGALSVPDGRVSIEGKMDGNLPAAQFSFLWRESGGPRVSRPNRKGFGSVILLDAAKQFGEDAKLKFEPQGVRYELLLPLESIAAVKERKPTLWQQSVC